MLINPSPGNRFVSFRSCVRCEAVCERETEMRFRLLVLQTDLKRRVACGVRSRSFAAFWFKNRTTPLRNRHFWLKMLPLSYGIVVFASTSKNAPTPLRNRHFCCGVFRLSYGIVVFAPASKMCPLLHKIGVFFSKCSHSRTESPFLLFYIFFFFFPGRFLIQKCTHSCT